MLAATTARHGQAAVAPVWFDDDGFLLVPENWSRQLAETLALDAGIATLTPKHWQVIDYVRERDFAVGARPVMRLVCRAAGVDRTRAHRLFSSCKTLWRIAGLPDPGPEAKSYMD